MSAHSGERSPALLGELLQAAERAPAPAPWLGVAAGGCAAVGLLAFLAGLALAPGAAWGAYLACWLFWTGAAQGAVAVTASLHLTESRWGRVVERMAEGLAAFLPLSVALLLLLPLGKPYLWANVHQASEHPVMIIGGTLLRDRLPLALLLAQAFIYLRSAAGRRRADQEPQPGGRGDRWLSVVVLALFCLTSALLAMDLHISLNPPFRSTVYPVIYMSASYYTALALIAILAVLWRRTGRLEGVIAAEDLLDLGNLVWGFALFLGYLWWCQYLPVWMANLPREAAYHLLRWRAWPWELFSYGALILAVATPGLLLSSRLLKKKDAPVLLASACGAAGVLLQRLVDVLPAEPGLGGFIGVLVAAGVCLGFAGLAGLCYLAAARRVPLFPVRDPKFIEALQVRKVKA